MTAEILGCPRGRPYGMGMPSMPRSGKSLDVLTEGQRACLRGVLAMKSSKEIAKDLGISPHTVDKRLKDAMKALGVASRVEAARLLAAAPDAPSEVPYQPLVSQSPDLSQPAPTQDSPAYSVPPGGNTLGPWQRLLIILGIAMAAPLLLGALASSLALAESLYLSAK